MLFCYSLYVGLTIYILCYQSIFQVYTNLIPWDTEMSFLFAFFPSSHLLCCYYLCVCHKSCIVIINLCHFQMLTKERKYVFYIVCYVNFLFYYFCFSPFFPVDLSFYLLLFSYCNIALLSSISFVLVLSNIFLYV